MLLPLAPWLGVFRAEALCRRWPPRPARPARPGDLPLLIRFVAAVGAVPPSVAKEEEEEDADADAEDAFNEVA